MERRLLLLGRDAHQPRHRQVERAAAGDERVGVRRQDARLLRLLAGVDLHEELGADPLLLGEAGERLGQPLAVHGVDGVEERRRGAGLVGLQRAHEVQLDALVVLAQGLPAALRLLHAVLAEEAVARVEHGAHARLGLELGDCDQAHGARRAPGAAFGGAQAVADGSEPGLGIGGGHGLPLSRTRRAKL